MFFGHAGVALAARPAAPKASLGLIMVAAMALDTLCGALTIFGIEGVGANGALSIPWSHGLFMSGVWSAATFGLVFLFSRKMSVSIVIGLLVFSHWVLDFISHPMGMGKLLPPDLPLLFDGSPKVGLGLYNSVAAAFLTDLGLFAGGIALYLIRTRSKDRTGKWVFWLVPLFLIVVALGSFLPARVSLLPTFLVLLLLPIGMWIDRHRSVVS